MKKFEYDQEVEVYVPRSESWEPAKYQCPNSALGQHYVELTGGEGWFFDDSKIREKGERLS